jgi:hypothetical protein
VFIGSWGKIANKLGNAVDAVLFQNVFNHFVWPRYQTSVWMINGANQHSTESTLTIAATQVETLEGANAKIAPALKEAR